jgi:hypothetical protein
MKTITCEVVDESTATQYRAEDPHPDDPADPLEVFMKKMEDSNYIASRYQIHNHNFTRFEYGHWSTKNSGEGLQ